ncbi:MAG TPA: hypothetical protein VJ371_11400, partial [Streptosporangiaceae bacterium]|nr:hypothetical protein [Streptosporangiaceae bacterium]
ATTLHTNNTHDLPAAAISTPPPGPDGPAARQRRGEAPASAKHRPPPAAARTRPCLGRAAGHP